jgi:hypothetical protein
MRFGRFRNDGNVRTVARRAQRDRKTDAAARAGDEERFPA